MKLLDTWKVDQDFDRAVRSWDRFLLQGVTDLDALAIRSVLTERRVLGGRIECSCGRSVYATYWDSHRLTANYEGHVTIHMIVKWTGRRVKEETSGG